MFQIKFSTGEVYSSEAAVSVFDAANALGIMSRAVLTCKIDGEMKELSTTEARIYKAIDNLEAVIQHNEADISTWLPLEYDLQLQYGRENVAFSPWFRQLKQELDQWTRAKISQETK